MPADQGQAEWSAAQWHGRMLVDSKGEKIGKLQDVNVDVDQLHPAGHPRAGAGSDLRPQRGPWRPAPRGPERQGGGGCTVRVARQTPRRAGPAWAGWGRYPGPW